LASISCRREFIGTIVTTSPLITSFQISKTRGGDLRFALWTVAKTRHQKWIVSEIATTLTAADNERYAYFAVLYKLVSLVNQGEFPSAQPLTSSFGMVGSHNQSRDYFLRLKMGLITSFQSSKAFYSLSFSLGLF
jgi:hypothetical protein